MTVYFGEKLDYLNTSSTELSGHTITPKYLLFDGNDDDIVELHMSRNVVCRQADNFCNYRKFQFWNLHFLMVNCILFQIRRQLDIPLTHNPVKY